LLAVAHGARSLPTFQLLEPIRDICRVLWIVDGHEPDIEQVCRLVGRFGPVVDIAGLDGDAAAALVAEYAPDGIIAYRDSDISRMSLIAAQLGLQFHEPEVARRLVDKLHQRRALADAGLPTPRVVEVVASGDPALADDVAARLQFPVVLKPRRGNGSEHVFRADDRDQLASALERCSRSRSRDTEFIVEEFLEDLGELTRAGYASFVSVETAVIDGTIHHLATNGRLPLAEPFRETGTFIPSQLDAAQVSSVLEVASAAITAIGVRRGCLHTEIKLTPSGPRVLEVNGRIGGGVPDMLMLASGLDILALSMRIALGQQPEVQDLIPCNKVGYRLMYQAPATAHLVSAIDGLDELPRLPGLHSFSVKHGPGETIDAADGSLSYVFELVGSVPDHASLLELVRHVASTVSVTYDREAS
jgi:biotin carboxylase